MQEVVDVELEDEEIEPVNPKFVAACEELEKRCTLHGLKYYENDSFFGKEACIELPSGRNKRTLRLLNFKSVKSLLSIEFEKFIFLGDYNAICSYSDGIIEAQIRPLTPIPPSGLYQRLSGQKGFKRVDEDTFLIEAEQEPALGNRCVSIQQSSESLKTLCSYRSPRLSLKLEGFDVSQHDHACNLLERIANSIFFQIDTSINLALGLSYNRRFPNRSTSRNTDFEFQFPKHEFDNAPLSLYWYARSATGMPLLQFLAYYQTMEFYFPIHSQAEAQRRVRNILKDPNFRADKDADVGKILATVRGSSNYGFSDERSQLKATLQECLHPDELREFLISDDRRKEFFSSKSKHLRSVNLPLNNATADLRNDVAERIYDIRCKIVHTKSGSNDGEIELLLPFSKEAESLHFDIELAQFLAKKVIIAGSNQMQL